MASYGRKALKTLYRLQFSSISVKMTIFVEFIDFLLKPVKTQLHLGQCYKTFHGHKLRSFVLSWSVCPS